MSERRQTYGRGLYLSALVFFSVLSVVGNAVYAYRAVPATVDGALPPAWAAVAHMIPPLALLLVTEVVAAASTRLPAGRARWVGLCGAAIIAVAAFALSFDALYAVAEMAKVRAELAWLVPVMLDVAIVVCTTLVLTASDRVRADRLVQMPVADVSSSGGDDPGDDPTSRTDELLVVRSTATSDDLVDATRRPARHRSDQARRDDEFTPTTSSSPVEQLVDEQVDAADELLVDASTTVPDELTDDPGDELVDDPTGKADEHARRADEVLASTSISADADELATVLAMIDDGASKQAIADAVGRSRSTVTGWINAAEKVVRAVDA